MNTVANSHSFQQDETGLSRVEYAYRKIKSNITSNTFPSGFQILEPDLASKLGISRTPVREALIRLEADNLIQLIPRRGMRVTPLSTKDIVELNEIIYCLEVAAIKSICSSLHSIGFDALELHLNELGRLTNSADTLLWVEHEDTFLLSLICLSGNFRFKETAEKFLGQFRRAKFIAFGFADRDESHFALHQSLLHALKHKDEEAALRSALEYHSMLKKLFENIQEKHQLKEL